MAAYLALKRKSNGATLAGRDLVLVDDELCEGLGVPVDAKNFYRHWLDRHGFRLALGQSFEEVRAAFSEPDDVAITDWLERNFENASYMAR